MSKLWFSMKSNLIPLSFMLSIPILNIFYGVLNNGSRGASSLITELDRATPLIKPFIIPYVLWYPFILTVLIYLCIKDRPLYYRTLIIFNLGLLVCYFVYYTYQTTVPRPLLFGDDMLTAMIRWIYNNDQPYNCFPSIHVFTSYLMARAVQAFDQPGIWFKHIIYWLSTLIIASTVFVKQHVILDVLGGILTVEAITFIVTAIRPILPIRTVVRKASN